MLMSCKFVRGQHKKNKCVHSSYVCTNISVVDENQPKIFKKVARVSVYMKDIRKTWQAVKNICGNI